MPQFVGSINRYPGRASLSWYGILILVGFAMLYLVPGCARDPANPISALDALFTSTSASCVTGLIVRSTAEDFSFLGQLVILGLIQLGGIGIMTVTTFIVMQFDRRGSARQRMVLVETLGADQKTDLRRILRNVLALTLTCELVGFAILAFYNLVNFNRFAEIGLWSTYLEAIWHALFHSVSAFCNAGFSLNDSSLVPFADSWVVNFTIGVLIIIGGLGFPVINDLRRSRHLPWSDRWNHLQLHTKIMLIGTAILLVIGFVSFLFLESQGTLEGNSVSERVLKASMHSITCRTAGFNTVDVANLTNATLFISLLLMAVGAGPCSTGGGFKVTTAAIIVMRAWATFQGFKRVNYFRRTIPARSVERAVATAMLFVVVAILALTTLLVIEQSKVGHQSSGGSFLELLFEVVSALGTVGLSTGLTTELTDLSRAVVVLLMLLGRLGPITTFVALSHGERDERVEYPNEDPMVG